ncbi:MAG: hypothetical protein NTW87_07060 [Planctomycetota bacterium]|nr:hypothetical protein [Planctomycetota bacterium]
MVVSRNKNAISFRHPLILDANGYGTIIHRGVGKLPKEIAGRIQEELDQLLKIKPRLRSEVAQLELHPLALDFWFEPLQNNRERERAVQE